MITSHFTPFRLLSIASLLAPQTYARPPVAMYSGGATSYLVVRLSAAEQAQVQAHYDRIYAKIRLPTDPITSPRIILVRASGAEAFVIPGVTKERVYVDYHHYLNASEEGRARVMAHELTHFSKRQTDGSRRFMDGLSQTFAHEVEAEVRSVLERIVRINLYDETAQPQAAAYNLERIIQELTLAPGESSSTHPHQHDVAEILRMVWAKERYRRRFPAASNDQVPAAVRRKILKAARALGPVVKQEDTVSAPREDAKTVANDTRKTADQHVVEKYETWKSRKTEANRDELLARLQSWATVSDDASAFPPNFFTDLRQAGITGYEVSPEFGRMLEDLVGMERYFARLSTFKMSDHEIAEAIDLFLGKTDRYKYARNKYRNQLSRKNLHLFRSALNSDWRLIAPQLVGKSLPKDGMNVAIDLKVLLATARKAKDPEIRRTWYTAAAAVAAEEWKVYTPQKRIQVAREMWRGMAGGSQGGLRAHIAGYAGRFLGEAIDELAVSGSAEELAYYIHPVARQGGEFDAQLADALRKRKAEMTAPLSNRVVQVRARMEFKNLHARLEARIKASRFDSRSSTLRNVVGTLLKGNLTGVDVPGLIQLGCEITLDPHCHRHLRGLGLTGTHANLDWLGRALSDSGYIDLEVKRIPQTLAILNEVAARAPIRAFEGLSRNFVASSKAVSWNQVIGNLSNEQFYSFLAVGRGRRNHGMGANFIGAIHKKVAALLQGARRAGATERERELAMAGVEALKGFADGASPHYRELIDEITIFCGHADRRYRCLGKIPKQLFPNTDEYVRFVEEGLAGSIDRALHASSKDDRLAAVTSIAHHLRDAAGDNDPITHNALANALAAKIQARPSERYLFSLNEASYSAMAGKGLEYANGILEAFSKSHPSEQHDFIRFLRGEDTALGPRLKREVASRLALRRVYVQPDALEPYLRQRFNELPPSARATVYKLLFSDSKGFFQHQGSRALIEASLIESLPATVRGHVKTLFEAAVASLPEGYHDLMLAAAYAESGTTGSPEKALALIFSRMGSLVRKFGQNLAFDTNLPLSYRRELMKLWDEGPRPGWWEVQGMLERRYGPIEKYGIRLIAIRNAGTTDIAVELEDASGKRWITTLQREAAYQEARVDYEDLKKFYQNLTRTKEGRQDFGFLGIQIEDSWRTIHLELDSEHKVKMAREMAQAYRETSVGLGDSLIEGGTSLRGWNLKSPMSSVIPLGNGKTIPVAAVASGIPLKNIEKTHPAEFREASSLLIDLEEAVQRNPRLPIDKDRMPGQYFIDLETRTITFLDAGQAKRISRVAFEARDPFIGSALTLNTRRLKKHLAPLGIRLSLVDQLQLARLLAGTASHQRPSQVLSWISSQAKFAGVLKKRGNDFFDLVHAVRAKTRLLHWGHSLKNATQEKRWRQLASQNMGVTARACSLFGRLIGHTSR